MKLRLLWRMGGIGMVPPGCKARGGALVTLALRIAVVSERDLCLVSRLSQREAVELTWKPEEEEEVALFGRIL